MSKKEKVHFIGIGGIGTSGLAQYYLEKGDRVSGSDLVASETTKALQIAGAKISFGKHKAKNVPKDVSLVIYSPAVQKDNPELKKAQKFKIQNAKLKIQSYPQALGELTKRYFTVAISGAHGKSTTTAMIALILVKAGLDPTVIVGTKLKEFGESNFRMGKSKYLVIEADEWQGSFLNYWPKIIVLTNIEKEHLDYYKNLGHILKTFQEYISHLPKNGWLVVNKDDKNISKIKNAMGKGRQFKIQNYSLKERETEILKKILRIPGQHNIYNALAALKVARLLKIPDKISFKSLSNYHGSWRRFQLTRTGLVNKRGRIRVLIISDYAHHPTEIRVTLNAVRERFPDTKIWCVFQPHQYQRTFYLFDDFVRVFALAPIDNLIITDIYDVAGRETKEIKKKVNSAKLIKAIKKFCKSKACRIYLPKRAVKNYLKKNVGRADVIIIMGAGDIYKLASEFSTQKV